MGGPSDALPLTVTQNSNDKKNVMLTEEEKA